MAQTNTASKNLVITGTDKGGTGKTLTTATLLEWLLEKHTALNIDAFDPDESNRSLHTRMPQLARLLPIGETRGRDGVSNALDQIFVSLGNGYDEVVVDAMGSQQTATLFPWAIQTGLFTHAREDYDTRVTIVLHAGEKVELVEQAGSVARIVGKGANYVVVRARWADAVMPLWDKSDARKTLLNELGAIEIEALPLADHLISRVWTGLKLPIGVGRHNQAIPIYDRRRMESWMNGMYAEFEKAASLLLPPAYCENMSKSAPKKGAA